MRKLLLTLALCCLAPRLATAQDAQTVTVAERVTYSRAIPKGLRAFVPHGGKSRFWGATKLKYNGKRVWVHVYNVRVINVVKGDELSAAKDYAPNDRQFVVWALKEAPLLQESGFDLFIVSKSRRLSRISSTLFFHRKDENETIGMEMLWLDPRTKKKPIFKANLREKRGFSGTPGLDMLIVFPDGIAKGTVKEGFTYGAITSSNEIFWGAVFDSLDESGNLIVRASYNENKERKTTTYKWKDNYFKVDNVETEATGP